MNVELIYQHHRDRAFADQFMDNEYVCDDAVW